MIKLTVVKSTEEDSYEHGEIGKGSYHDLYTQTFKTLQQAYDYIVCAYGTPYIFDDRLEAQTQENADGYAPTANELARFKEGEINLYECTYSFYLSKVVETKIGNEALVVMFPHLENAS